MPGDAGYAPAADDVQQAFSIKNTFIDVDEDEIFMDMSSRARRQVSEPARPMQRQSSSLPFQQAHAPETRLSGVPEPTELSEPEDEPRMHSTSPPCLPLSTIVNSRVRTGVSWQDEEVDSNMVDQVDGWPYIDMRAPEVASNIAPQAMGEVPPGWETTTTVMMRNVPNKYTQGMLLTELNETGFLGHYDFFYLPMDPETCANRGYAFVNFIDSGAAWLFKITYEGRKMKFFNSSKHVSVTPATLQGFDANYAHYSSSRVSRGDPAARPLFLRSPSNVALLAGQRRSRQRRRGHCSVVDMAVQQHIPAMTNSVEQLQQTAAAIVASKKSETRSPAAQNAMAVAASAAALANSLAGAGEQNQRIPKNSVEVSNTPKFCPFCGGAIKQSFRFCQFCGANLEQYTMPKNGDQTSQDAPEVADAGLGKFGAFTENYTDNFVVPGSMLSGPFGA